MAGEQNAPTGAAARPPDWTAREARQADAYDAIGPRYDEAFPHKDGQVECTGLLLERLRPGARVLDVGCGTGLPTALALDAAGCAVTGIDISPVMLELARRNVPGAVFEQQDLADLAPPAAAEPGRAAHFDAVVAFFSLLHLPRAMMAETIGRLRALLAPGGLFAYAMVEADVDDTAITFLGERVRVTGYPRFEWRALLAECGFEPVWEHVLSYAPASVQAAPEIQIFGLSRRAD